MSLYSKIKNIRNPDLFFGKPETRQIGTNKVTSTPTSTNKPSFFLKATKVVKTGFKYKEKYDRFMIQQNRLAAKKAKSKTALRRAQKSLRSSRPKNLFSL